MTIADADIALYVHWPWCLAKCPYCDFNSHAQGTTAPDPGDWAEAYARALARWRDLTGPRTVRTVFFGGGTPSLMDPALVGALLEKASDLWGLSDNTEVTLEANPGASEAGRFQGFRAAGVDRLSLGVQSFDDRALRFLGRVHDGADAIQAIETARKIFPRLSLDLIYARPGQDVRDWLAEMERAVAFAPDHLSPYQLTIEPGTAFFRQNINAANEELAVTLYETTQNFLRNVGFLAYEISNHARPGQECRHNLHVWRGGDYVGVGPGAHGRITAEGRTFATTQPSSPPAWMARPEGAATPLTARDRAVELLILGLRLGEGIDGAGFEARTGLRLGDVVDKQGLSNAREHNLIRFDNNRLRATDLGLRVLDRLLADLI